MSHKHNDIAIMDDLLAHSKKENHLDRIVDQLKALIKHSLKLSSKKCPFFKTVLIYMRNVFKGAKVQRLGRFNFHLHYVSQGIARECPSLKYADQRDSGNLTTLNACALSGLSLQPCDGYFEPISIQSE